MTNEAILSGVGASGLSYSRKGGQRPPKVSETRQIKYESYFTRNCLFPLNTYASICNLAAHGDPS
jgi:hypothetical protein